MPRYLLLPGSDGLPTVWDVVRRLLVDRGHEVDAHRGWDDGSGLAAQIARVVDQLDRTRADTLVTWSYSGLVGALAAQQPSSLRTVAHVDALLPGMAATEEELRRLVAPIVLRRIAPDTALALAPVDPAVASVYLACIGRPRKPAFEAVRRSAELARRSGWPVRELATGHRPMQEDPRGLVAALLG